MNMIRQLKLGIVSFIMIFSTIIVYASFTEKRGKRGPSIGSLQESCCELFADFLQSSSRFLTVQGKMQLHAVDAIEGYARSNKESWCMNAPKQKLMLCKEKLEKCNTHFNELIEECKMVWHEINAG